MKALSSMLATTTSRRGKGFVKKGLSDRNGMIAFGRVRWRCGKTAGVAKLTDVCQFRVWKTEADETGERKLLRQGSMTFLGDDARETLKIAGLEKAKERLQEQHLRSRAPQTWVILCASADQFRRTTVNSRAAQPTPMKIGAVVSTCACCGKSGQDKSKFLMYCAKCSNCGQTGHLKKMCRQREKADGKATSSGNNGKSSGKGAKNGSVGDAC